MSGCAAEKKTPPPPPPKAVDVLTVKPTPVRDTAEYLGSLISRQSVTVLPQVGGYVKAINVRPGQKVKAGQVLVEIDARDKAAILDSSVAQQRSAQARLELAQQTAVRAEALTKEGLGSTQELERAQAEVAASQAALSAANASIAQQQVTVGFASVRAAVAGTVGEVPIRIGDAVTPTTWLTTIAQSQTLELSLSIPPTRARLMPADSVVEVLDQNGAVLVTAPIFYIAPQADAATQLVVVKAVFENTVNLRPNELVRTRVVYGSGEALQVPAMSVVRQSGQAFVFVVGDKDGKKVVNRRPVQLGRLGALNYVVESGLEAGEVIAVTSLQALRDGAAIVPTEAKPETLPTPAPPATPETAGPTSPSAPNAAAPTTAPPAGTTTNATR
ncbi:MAG TPA: efflux RND transporter periplasmic adaptor subunit [Myxococcota bacterium]